MAFGKEELQQLDSLFDSHLSQQERRLRLVIKEEIDEVKEHLDRLFNMENEDILSAYGEIEDLKKRVTKLERQLSTLK